MDWRAIWTVSANELPNEIGNEPPNEEEFREHGTTKKDLLCIGNEDETRVSGLSVSALRMCSIC